MSQAPDALRRAKECLQQGMVEAAEELLARACKKDARNVEAVHLHGMVLFQLGRHAQGLAQLERAVKLKPANAALRTSLANALMMRNEPERAARQFREAIKSDRNAGAAHLGLSLALLRTHDLDHSIQAAKQALALLPSQFQPCVNLASALRQAGCVKEAIAVLESASQRFPQNAEVLSQLLAARNYADQSDPAVQIAEARRFGKLIGPPDDVRWPNNPDPHRPLRVGYLSADLRTHSVAYFLEPILQHHDRTQVETIGYCVSARADQTTDRLRALCSDWVDAATLDLPSLIERIRADRIDILVELGGHTGGNRLAALARGCAPVQVTYLGYPNTTGVPAIQYRLVDALTDPHGAEQYATEELVRIEDCFLCYAPPADALAPAPPPVLQSGLITFGSFNSLPKTGDAVFDQWAGILQRVPNSRLVLKNRSLASAGVRQRVGEAFAGRGVDASRIELLGQTATPAEHLAAYARVDIALDTFPYNGTTTTCEALWMGVPVIALQGRVHAARVGVSLLTAVGVSEWIAASQEQYVQIAAELAGDAARLAQRRASLRARMAASTLCDGKTFARKLEAAYRAMWQGWCAARQRSGA